MLGTILIIDDNQMNLVIMANVCIIETRKEFASFDPIECFSIEFDIPPPNKSTFSFHPIASIKGKILSRTRWEVDILRGKSSIPP